MKHYLNCRLCGSSSTIDVWDFGATAPANAYINPKNPSINEEFPLKVFLCINCSSVQLRDTVSPEKLFKNYKYASSTIPSLVKHFSKMAFDIREAIPQKSNFKALEIGSNDGVLLRQLKAAGFSVLGVEPSDNLAELANKEGLPTEASFFDASTAKRIRASHGEFDVVVSNNCFAHIDNIKSVVEGINTVLSDNGFFVFENAYLADTVNGLYFDQVYSEHLFYHSVKPLKAFFDKYDLEIFKVERVNIQGGSIRVFVKKLGNSNYKIDKSVQEFISYENNLGLSDTSIYNSFFNKLINNKNELLKFINTETKKGKTFSAYGAAAKFTTFSSFFGLDSVIKYVVDDSPLKHGLLTPHSLTPIINRNEFMANPTDYCIITAWNFADNIVKNNTEFTLKGGKFINPLPSLQIL